MYEDWLNSTNDAEDYIGSKNVTYVAPTCTEAGSITFQCDVCGESVRVFEQEALGHQNAALEAWDYCFATDPDFGTDEDLIQYTSWNNVDYTPATCTKPGLVTFKCGTCQAVMRTMTVTALGHSSDAYEDYLAGSNDPEDYIGWPNVVYKAPSCTETGSVTFRCDTCKAEIATFDLAALGHKNAALEAWDYCFEHDPDFGTDEDLLQYTSWYNVDYKPATCTEAGVVTFKCATCQAVMRTITVAALGHTEGYTKVITAATCATAGELGTYCGTCDKLLKTEVIEAPGHDYGEWTLNGDGTHSRSCSRCSFTDKAKCKYNAVVTDPTCTKDGYTTYTCADCGYTYKDELTDALGHDFSAWTDDSNGETHSRTCSRCPEKETTEHSFGEWVYNKDAGFFKNGTKSMTCADCGCVVTEEAQFTAWIWYAFYPMMLWVGSIVRKSVFLGSLAWFLPGLNITPKM